MVRQPNHFPLGGKQGFFDFCERVGLALEPFQRKIAAAAFADRRELLVLLPRGNGKSTLMGALAVHHLLTVEHPSIYVAAASRDQARVIFEYARLFATHPSVAGRITVRHLELRVDGGYLRVLASDAPKLHGLTPSLAVVDELHAFRDPDVYVALRTAMLKRPGARMVTISTAAQGAGSPLGQLRARALAAPVVVTKGALTDARASSLRMLEWAVAEDASITDMRRVKAANPASWLTSTALREQLEAVPELAFRRYHCGQWTAREGAWLPPGTWQAAIGPTRFEEGEPIWAGLDVGGSRAATALVWISEARHVGAQIWQGDDGILHALDAIRELRQRHELRELAYDPWRAQQAALELEREGVCVVTFPQNDARMCPASDRLHRAIVEGDLTLPDHPTLAEHAANAVQRHSRRGWRIDAPDRASNIDGIVALAMALERVEHRPEPAALVGWL